MKKTLEHLHERALRESGKFLDEKCWNPVHIEMLWGLMEIAYHARKELEAMEEECEGADQMRHDHKPTGYGMVKTTA